MRPTETPTERPGPAADRPAAVEVRDLTVRYGSGDTAVPAVDRLDLRLDHGRVLALLGPNGAGKTTTVEVCEGARERTSGSVTVLGRDPAGAPDELHSRLGVMPQGGGAYPNVRAHEMLRLVAACAADPLDPAWLLEVLALDSCARLPYKRLSGGQQQRLSLACAVVGRPEVVFLDEPTASLDPQGRHLVWDLVRALRADGVAVLLTTHLMAEAEALADDVVIVDHGRVVAAGTPEALTASDATSELRFRAPARMDLGRLTDALPEGFDVDETTPGSYRVRGAIDPQVLATVTAWCARQGVLADDLAISRRSLEDVFLEVTGRELRA